MPPDLDLPALADLIVPRLAEALRAEQDQLLDRAGLAERLGVGERTIGSMVARGELPLPLLHTGGVTRWLWEDVLRRVVTEIATALACPPDYVAVPVLVMCGVALGASRVLAVKGKHIQRAALYVGVIGPPGSAKTPAQDMVAEPILDEEEDRHESWQAEVEEYERAAETYEGDLKEWKKTKVGDRPEKPKRPVLRRLVVSDATTESIIPILNENPRGVAYLRDELTGWVASMNQYPVAVAEPPV